MSTDIRLSKAQISKIIQSPGFLGKTFGKLGKKVLLDLAIPLAKDVLPNLATIATSSVLDKFEKKKKTGQGAVGAGSGPTLLSQMKMKMILLR